MTKKGTKNKNMSNKVFETLEKYPIIPVFYHADIAVAQKIVKACYDGGMRAFEFTNRGENALEVFAALRTFTKTTCPDMLLGIGTIFTEKEAKKFAKAGADFIVQPITTKSVGKFCAKKDIPWMPAAMTLTEIYKATLLGAKVVKIFPGNVVGSGFIKSIKGPMPHAKLMVTGGVEPTIASLDEWFGAGVHCVGIGSQLFKNLSDVAAIQENISKLMIHVQGYK
jgi:2-dehydro-3-deoxyphosphogluconate aldolase / (4S)-4-hydroxy-2-oxoglutarate aldolase